MIYAVGPLIIYDGVSLRPRLPYTAVPSWRPRSIRPAFCTGVGSRKQSDLTRIPRKATPTDPAEWSRVRDTAVPDFCFYSSVPKVSFSIGPGTTFRTVTRFWPIPPFDVYENGQRRVRLDRFSNERRGLTASDALTIQWICEQISSVQLISGESTRVIRYSRVSLRETDKQRGIRSMVSRHETSLEYFHRLFGWRIKRYPSLSCPALAVDSATKKIVYWIRSLIRKLMQRHFQLKLSVFFSTNNLHVLMTNILSISQSTLHIKCVSIPSSTRILYMKS